MRFRSDRARLRAAEIALAQAEGEGPEVAAAELRADPSLAAEVQALSSITELLGDMPGEAWRAIPSTPAERSPRRLPVPAVPRSVPRLVAGLAMLACLAVGLGLGAGIGGSGSSSSRSDAFVPGDRLPRAPHVTLAPLPGVPAHDSAVAYMSAATRHMLLHVDLPPSPPGTYYELWLMSSPTDLVPVTSFRIGPRGEDDVNVLLPGDPARYRYLDVSLQSLGGGTAHSGDSLVRGKIGLIA